MIRTVAAAALTAIAILGGPAAAAPDTVYLNAKVVTVDPQFSIAQAVAVGAGKITAVGTTATVKAMAGPATKVVDLGGKTMLPGFNDIHVHLGPPLAPWKFGGMIEAETPWVKGADTIPALMANLSAYAATLKPGEWVIGEIARENWTNDGMPTRWDLDKAAPNNPVAIARGPHTLLVNTAALEAAHVTRDTEPGGGEIVRDANGEPNGKVLDSARRVIMAAVPPEKRIRSSRASTSAEVDIASWHTRYRQVTSLGITSVNVAVMRPENIRNVQALYDRYGDDLPRMVTQFRITPGYDGYDDLNEGVRASIAEIDALGPDRSQVFHHPKLKMGALKMVVDGGLSAPLFWSIEEYKGRPGHHGQQIIPDWVFYKVAKHAHALGWQFGIHTMGDAATQMATDQLAKILDEAPRPGHRDYLHHVAVPPPEETLRKMAKHHINVSSQPNFLVSLGSYAEEALGPEKAARLSPGRSLLDHGIRVAYGADGVPYGPLITLYAAVTRHGRNGVAHGPEEAVTIEEAVRMHTLEPAYFTFDEQVKGSIEPGKFADFVVLSDDILTIDPKRIPDIKVELTIIGDKEVYRRGAAAAAR